MENCYMSNKKVFNDLIIYLWNSVARKEDVQECIIKMQNFDKEIYSHSLMVAVLSGIIGAEMKVDKLENLFISGLLHDYGKLFIPPYILNKPGIHTDIEKEIMRKHPALGYQALIKSTNCSQDILNGVRDHHMKIDGSGYGSKGRISIFGRIIAVADVYSAMVTKRVYRDNEYSHDYVKDYISDNTGILFDEKVTNIFLDVIDVFRELNKKGV